MTKFEEFETIVLKHDIAEYNLKEGDIGTVVHVYKDKKAVEVEFVTAAGKTVTVITLDTKDVRLLKSNEIFHVRGHIAI